MQQNAPIHEEKRGNDTRAQNHEDNPLHGEPAAREVLHRMAPRENHQGLFRAKRRRPAAAGYSAADSQPLLFTTLIR